MVSDIDNNESCWDYIEPSLAYKQQCCIYAKDGSMQLIASLMSLMASLVTTSRMQHFNVLIDIYHEFL